MSVEVATWITELVSTNPPSSDPRSQGDDHLRLIKAVLQNCFPDLSKAVYAPKILSKSANYTIVKADANSTIYVSTASGSVTLTGPALVAGDAGWSVGVMKTTTDANPIFIAPPSGTLSSGQFSSLAQARRAIPGVEFRVVWDGTKFIVGRCIGLPVGSMITYDSASLPAGYEWPNGQTLTSASTLYPEYNAAKGSGLTLDLRGRVPVTLDNLGGSAAGRLTGGVITGTAVGTTGGADIRTLLTVNLPPYIPSGSISIDDHFHQLPNFSAGGIYSNNGNNAGSPVFSSIGAAINTTFISSGGSAAFNGAAQGGLSTPFGILQPSIMCSKILVVE